MKVVYYPASDPWVGEMECSACHRLTPAWQSSGMSEGYPHFYCDTCSNCLHRESDKELVYAAEQTQELLESIASSLPRCSCGGQFKPGADPKCPFCSAPYVSQLNPVQRLAFPHMILLDGACLIRDRLSPYQVSIGSHLKYLLRVVRSAF